MRDWYKVSASQLVQRGGSPLLQQHKSLYKIFSAVYPDYPWVAGKFRSSRAHRRWSNISDQRKFLESIAPSLGVKEVRITHNVLLAWLLAVRGLVWDKKKRYYQMGRRGIISALFIHRKSLEGGLSWVPMAPFSVPWRRSEGSSWTLDQQR